MTIFGVLQPLLISNIYTTSDNSCEFPFSHEYQHIILKSILYLPSITGNYSYDYRLVNGKTQYEGRLEIRRNGGPWGTISAANPWSSKQASVACRSLGFSSSTLSPDATNEIFGPGTGPVHLVIDICYGHEQSILDCSRSDWDAVPLIHTTHCCDVGLFCMPGKIQL